MKEHPILFSAPMVRAILDGSKTQTRRVWKMPRGCMWYEAMGGEREGWFIDPGQPWWPHVGECRCPYGVPGDRLWVREAWRRDIFDHEKTLYRATHGDRTVFDKWKPSIHMPRVRSRITLEVTGVRVERLQDISKADARAEGVRSNADTLAETGYADARFAYRSLWETINGAGSWDANPWVWVVEFRKLP